MCLNPFDLCCLTLILLLVWTTCCSVSMGTEVSRYCSSVCAFTPCGIYIYETAHILFASPDLLFVEVYLARCFQQQYRLAFKFRCLRMSLPPFYPDAVFGFAGEICSLVSNRQMAPVF